MKLRHCTFLTPVASCSSVTQSLTELNSACSCSKKATAARVTVASSRTQFLCTLTLKFRFMLATCMNTVAAQFAPCLSCQSQTAFLSFAIACERAPSFPTNTSSDVGRYSKHKGHGYFQARRRVFSSGMVAVLIMRLIFPRYAKCRARASAASQYLPMQIYRGLMLKADDFDDDNPACFVDSGGYRFSTLFKHRHSRTEHVSSSGTVTYSGECKAYEGGRKALPCGWEVCPPDDVSIAVCTNYMWQSVGLIFSDGKQHATLGCVCPVSSSNNPRQPHIHPTSDFDVLRTLQGIKGRDVIVRGTDVLLRRPCYPAFVVGRQLSAPSKEEAGGGAEREESDDEDVFGPRHFHIFDCPKCIFLPSPCDWCQHMTYVCTRPNY
jgi:hypothetical protein